MRCDPNNQYPVYDPNPETDIYLIDDGTGLLFGFLPQAFPLEAGTNTLTWNTENVYQNAGLELAEASTSPSTYRLLMLVVQQDINPCNLSKDYPRHEIAGRPAEPSSAVMP